MGIFALASLILIFVRTLTKLIVENRSFSFLMLVSIGQFLILGSFDHYIFTITQTQLLFWLTLGMSLAYNDVDET